MEFKLEAGLAQLFSKEGGSEMTAGFWQLFGEHLKVCYFQNTPQVEMKDRYTGDSSTISSGKNP